MIRKLPLTLKAVIFDMDGVITDTMPYHFAAWQDTFSSVGIKVGCYDIYSREGQDGLSTVREIFRKHGRRFSLWQGRQLLIKKERLFNLTAKKSSILSLIGWEMNWLLLLDIFLPFSYTLGYENKTYQTYL